MVSHLSNYHNSFGCSQNRICFPYVEISYELPERSTWNLQYSHIWPEWHPNDFGMNPLTRSKVMPWNKKKNCFFLKKRLYLSRQFLTPGPRATEHWNINWLPVQYGQTLTLMKVLSSRESLFSCWLSLKKPTLVIALWIIDSFCLHNEMQGLYFKLQVPSYFSLSF